MDLQGIGFGARGLASLDLDLIVSFQRDKFSAMYIRVFTFE
jgi:hypothetical protein